MVTAELFYFKTAFVESSLGERNKMKKKVYHSFYLGTQNWFQTTHKKELFFSERSFWSSACREEVTIIRDDSSDLIFHSFWVRCGGQNKQL